ncbi:hypothetical protein WNY37_07860 [Henriciella sp. AS95]|uniref:hypothetical protein n=1 Tax=Henriciella sp. AS95 TaxID=3135782 RepID=UPI00317103FD
MNKILLLSGAMLGIVMPSFAEEASQPVSTSAVYACSDIAEDSERLACYDAAVGRLKLAEESGEVVTVTREEVDEVQRDSFGFNLPSLPKLVMPKFGNGKDDGQIKEVTLPIDRIEKSRTGKLTVYLENGQVWYQIGYEEVRYSKRKGAEMATIKSAALGSFMMKLDGGRAFRVRREK